MKKIKYLSLIFIVGLFTLSSCTKGWEDLNKDPNNPTDVPATNILAHSLRYPAQFLFDSWQGMNNFLSYGGQVTKIQYTDEAHYIYRETVVNSAWRDYYITLLDLKKIVAKASDGEDDEYESNMKAVAITFSAFLWQMATDQWGDIPYTEALRSEEGITNPAYDSQQDIYMALIDTLADAATMFDPLDGANTLGDGDILYGDDIAKWQKFCNSLRLRLAIRISYVDPAKAGEIISEILGDSDKYPIFESNADAALFKWTGVLPYVEPWYDNKYTSNRDEHGAAYTIVTTLDELSDPRLAIYADEAPGGGYIGQVEGAGTNTSVSRPGTFFVDNPAGYTYFMRYAELEFIISEAYARGLGVSADLAMAKTHYEAGINASFAEYDLDATAYLTSTGVAWGDDVTATISTYATPALEYGTNSMYLKQIYLQKWLAMFKQGQEVWAESRRTDFPQVAVNSLSPYTGHIRQAFRYPYPTDESNLNSSNLSTATTGIEDEFWGKQMWWDVRTGVK